MNLWGRFKLLLRPLHMIRTIQISNARLAGIVDHGVAFLIDQVHTTIFAQCRRCV